jgi:hypothetical protein
MFLCVASGNSANSGGAFALRISWHASGLHIRQRRSVAGSFVRSPSRPLGARSALALQGFRCKMTRNSRKTPRPECQPSHLLVFGGIPRRILPWDGDAGSPGIWGWSLSASCAGAPEWKKSSPMTHTQSHLVTQPLSNHDKTHSDTHAKMDSQTCAHTHTHSHTASSLRTPCTQVQ